MLDMASRQSREKSIEKRVIGYARVSTTDQADNGVSLSAQVEAIRAECSRNGWQLVRIVEDAGVSGKSMRRPGLTFALDALRQGEGNVLMAAKLDRLSRSTRDVCELGDMAQHYGFDLCLLDARIDTTTPHGRAQLSMMATFAQLERELIGVRTKEALAVKAAQGVKLGRRATVSICTAEYITRMKRGGMTLRAIADRLNMEKVPTGQGGARWHASTVKAVIDRAEVLAA